MGDEERETLEKQHAAIIQKIAMAEGAFKATGYVGGAVIVLVLGIFTYAFNKIESHGRDITTNQQAIAVIKSREPEYERWRNDVNKKLERVVYRK
jgi:hypothetical protein